MLKAGEVEANLARLSAGSRMTYIAELIARKSSGSEREGLADADIAFTGASTSA